MTQHSSEASPAELSPTKGASQTSSDPTGGPGASNARLSIVSVLIAMAVGACFYWISTPQTLDFLQWVVWVPLFRQLKGQSARHDFLLGWVAGTGLNVAGFHWIVHTISVFSNLPLPVAVLCMLLFALWGGLPYGMYAVMLPRLRSRFGSLALLLGPMSFVAIEYVFPLLFPYHQGDLQFRNLPIFQVASLLGIAGVSFLVMAVNQMWLELIDAQRGRRPWPTVAAPLLAAVLVACMVWGGARVKSVEAGMQAGPQVKIGLIQGNYGVAELRRTTAEAVFERYTRLSQEAVAKGASLVIWGEGASPYAPWHKERSEALKALAASLQMDFLFGSGGRNKVNGEVLHYNSAYALPLGATDYQRYDKNVPLAFGEYIPGAKTFPWLKKAIKGPGDFAAGEGGAIFQFPSRPLPVTRAAEGKPAGQTPEVRAMPMICYEAILDEYVLKYARQYEPNLLVNITHDAWFGDTACPHQFLMLVSTRAVEHGTSVARVANTGISAVVDPTGRIRGQTPVFQTVAAVENVFLQRFPTLFDRLGQSFSVLCTLVACACILLLRRPQVHPVPQGEGP